MNRPNITPGPWTHKDPYCAVLTDTNTVAMVDNHYVPTERCPYPVSLQERGSNAQAIAAVPQLLDTLEQCLIHTAAMQMRGYTVRQRCELAASTHAKIKAALLAAGYTE